jgi:hypothetical protein
MCLQLLKSFVKGIHNEFETIIKRVRSDNGSEFKNTRIDELCDDFEIRHQFSAKYTPQSNGLVERKNRTLIDMARSMLSEYNVSQSFWAEAINMACYCSNRLYCHPLKDETPYELLNVRKPNITYFWVFGCKYYILKKGTRLNKFVKKCDEDVFTCMGACKRRGAENGGQPTIGGSNMWGLLPLVWGLSS